MTGGSTTRELLQILLTQTTRDPSGSNASLSMFAVLVQNRRARGAGFPETPRTCKHHTCAAPVVGAPAAARGGSPPGRHRQALLPHRQQRAPPSARAAPAAWPPACVWRSSVGSGSKLYRNLGVTSTMTVSSLVDSLLPARLWVSKDGSANSVSPKKGRTVTVQRGKSSAVLAEMLENVVGLGADVDGAPCSPFRCVVCRFVLPLCDNSNHSGAPRLEQAAVRGTTQSNAFALVCHGEEHLTKDKLSAAVLTPAERLASSPSRCVMYRLASLSCVARRLRDATSCL